MSHTKRTLRTSSSAPVGSASMIAVHISPFQRRLAPWSVLTVLALVVALLGAQAPQSARAADPSPIPGTVTLVGSLQSELGCGGDWDPACEKTHLQRVGDSPVFAGRFTVPEGSWELKVALNDSWDESYGQDGGESNIALTLAGP